MSGMNLTHFLSSTPSNTSQPILISAYEAIFISVFSIFSLTTGMIGNLVVYVASHKYQSFDIDSITLLFIRHLSLADIGYLTSQILPWCFTSFFKRWIFGGRACYVTGLFYAFGPVANVGFIIAVSAHRLGRCVIPLRMAWLTVPKAYAVVMIVWLLALGQPILQLSRNSMIIFEPVVTYCIPQDMLLESVSTGVRQLTLIWAPFLIMLGLNIAILIQARRATNSLSAVAIKTVCSVCGVFLTGWCVALLRILFTYLGLSYNAFQDLNRIGRYFFTFSSFANPILYTIINKRFKLFIVKNIKAVFCIKQVGVNRLKGVKRVPQKDNDLEIFGNMLADYSITISRGRGSNVLQISSV